jgi:parvulin-like peptidyl-prolyl isomerase
MSKRGLTEGALVQQVRSELARNGVLSRGCDPTDAQVREFYKFNSDPKNPKGIFYTPETVSLVAIVTETEGMARSAARDIAAGVPFTTAAKTYSKDPTKGAGIGISALQRGRTQYKAIPGFEATVFAMKIGDQVGPRQLGGKWWVIRCMDKKPAVTIPFEKVKGDCRGFLALQMGRTKNGKKVEEEFAKWRKEGRIVALTPRYQSVVDAAKE